MKFMHSFPDFRDFPRNVTNEKAFAMQFTFVRYSSAKVATSTASLDTLTATFDETVKLLALLCNISKAK